MSRVWSTWNGNLIAFPLLITAVTKLGNLDLLGLSAVINANKMTLIVGQGSMTSVSFLIVCLGSFRVVTCAFTINKKKFVRWDIFNPLNDEGRKEHWKSGGFWTLNLLNGSEMSPVVSWSMLHENSFDMSHVKLNGLCFSLDGSCCLWILKCGRI